MTDKITEGFRQKQKKEAVRRMRLLNICDGIIEDFSLNGKVQGFETNMGIGYWLTEPVKKAAEEFEKRTGSLVYGAIKSKLDFYGDIQTHWSLLYVSKDADEWENDCRMLEQATPETVAYVWNESDPWMSEAGYIGMCRTIAGGLYRIY